MTDLNRKYKGDGKRIYEALKHKDVPEKPEPYVADPDLAEAVNMALLLRRPLLLEGDPGCGKTCLAYAVAYELGYPLKTCYIRSTTRAQDLLYNYDQLRRLYDIQEGKTCQPENENQLKNAEIKPPPKEDYRELRELGEAIRISRDDDMPSVVLIDEIDKADIDFPNDLLLVLDEWKFTIHETQETYDALKGSTIEDRKNFLPLVIITSNREKELPAPFLRRCLYYYIEFPNRPTLNKILASHFENPDDPLFKHAVNKFMELREKPGVSWRKQPSTSELIDWIHLLKNNGYQGEDLDKAEPASLPFLEALVKTLRDLKSIAKSIINK
ncbi:AAA ATPase-like domain-containing protein [Desulfonema limicola]|uniref:AAA ATPase-like domain-containing protein n=1 Tax=Desulfonema limicola TaxID=45656 RepID=A0A975BCI7_9BACT|nr:MoxR family ATPase [Desulfonema limicola]QTA82861.1 AAA ATPase-like domain-containing protein [Desulfonema limicola]